METSGSKYTISDRLAIALACGSVVMLIALFLAERTPTTVAILVILMVGFSVYPIWHFVRSLAVRILGLVVILIVGVVLGLSGIRLKKPAEAEAHSQQPPEATETEPQSNAPRTPPKKTASPKKGQDNPSKSKETTTTLAISIRAKEITTMR